MEDIKIGALTFKPKAIRIIALCLLFNFVTIGAMVALKNTVSSPSIFVVYPLLFMPYLFGSKAILDNVIEATSNRSFKQIAFKIFLAGFHLKLLRPEEGWPGKKESGHSWCLDLNRANMVCTDDYRFQDPHTMAERQMYSKSNLGSNITFVQGVILGFQGYPVQ